MNYIVDAPKCSTSDKRFGIYADGVLKAVEWDLGNAMEHALVLEEMFLDSEIIVKHEV